jgi:hypothetical protein
MIGQPFRAPPGFGGLRSSETYFHLRADSDRKRVFFVSFDNKPVAQLHTVAQDKVESALAGGRLVAVDNPTHQPPWIANNVFAKLLKPTSSSKRRRSAGGEYATWKGINERRRLIDDAINDIEVILSSDDPQRALNEYARKCVPVQNETRFRTWVLAYLVFGRQAAALAPMHYRRGGYDRTAPVRKGSTFGRLDNDLNPCAFRMTRALARKVKTSFSKEAKQGMTRQEVYLEAMVRHFGCVAEGDAETGFRFIQPQGKPFPSQDQYWYQCEKEQGIDGIKKILRGKETYRNNEATSQGKYSEKLTNVCQRVHGDAEHIADAPRSYTSDEPLPALVKVQLIDGLSGYCVGVGFSLGSETGQCYLDALFCMAVPKPLFGKLIGYPIGDEEWPGHGVMSTLLVDRGAGASASTLMRLQKLGIWRQMTPSYSPQSNSPVESRHARKMKMSGGPTHLRSGLTPAQMVKREVQKTLELNASSSAVDRASNEQLCRGVYSPYQLHTDMLKRLRCDAQQISVEDAVRTFLTPIEFTVSEDLLKLNGRAYGGEALRKSALGQSLRKRNGTTVDGYALSIAARYTWVDVGGTLVMVEALLPFGDGEEQTHLSLHELESLGGRAAKLRTKQRKQGPAAKAASAARVREHTGHADVTPKLRTGRKCPASTASQREAKTLGGQ